MQVEKIIWSSNQEMILRKTETDFGVTQKL